jgi:hypothetical protein
LIKCVKEERKGMNAKSGKYKEGKKKKKFGSDIGR